MFSLTTSADLPSVISDISRVFFGRPVHTPNPRRRHHGWHQAEKFPKFVPPTTLKIHSLALSVLRFFCQNYSSFHYEKVFSVDDFKKNHIQKNLHGCKLARATKRSELRRCSKEHRRNYTKQCKTVT